MPASLTHLLVDTATVQRLLETNRGAGRWVRELQPVVEGVPFRSFAAGAAELALGQQLRANVSHVGYCEADLDVAKDDQILVTLKEGQTISGEQYRVTAVLTPSLIHHKKLLMEFIAQGK